MRETKDILISAKKAEKIVRSLSTQKKNEALYSIADGLEKNIDNILKANKEDLENAKGKIPDVMLDRLFLDEKRLKSMADGVRALAKLEDPVGRVIEKVVRPNGLIIEKTSIPIGVIAIIYESRPNVTSDAAALCLKSGNVCILKSGSDAFLTSFAVVKSMRASLKNLGLPPDIINIMEDTSRKGAEELMKAEGYVDLLIPRGGAGLIRACVKNATVPCIQTGTGICHIYVDESADINMALNIIENAKTSRPSVCNALEVCLVNKNIAKEFLPKLKNVLVEKRIKENKIPVELRLDEKAIHIIDGVKCGENDFDTEFLDYILAIKIVDNVEDAINHISLHSTGHSEAIISNNEVIQNFFLENVDSAAVYVNSSTRFTDGGEFGLGCEMGISTQKLHARGPMGLRELNTYQYRIKGNGQIR